MFNFIKKIFKSREQKIKELMAKLDTIPLDTPMAEVEKNHYIVILELLKLKYSDIYASISHNNNNMPEPKSKELIIEETYEPLKNNLGEFLEFLKK